MGSFAEAVPQLGSAATKLRRLITSPGPIILGPGVYDGFSARIALSVGFEVIYMTGAGTSASRIGHADLGIANLNDMRANAEMIASLDPTIPLIADADTGYGGMFHNHLNCYATYAEMFIAISLLSANYSSGPIMVTRTIHQYARSGVAGLHIEDQVQTKRCGHLQGKQLVSTEEYLMRIRAAVSARKSIGSDIVIIARTDALQSLGYEESILRLKAATDAGADVAFLEGITSKEEAKQVVKDMAPFPVLLNMVEHGVTPSISVSEAQEMGFKIVIFPFAGLAPAYKAMKDVYQRLKTEGVTGAEADMTPKQLFSVSGLKEDLEIDAAAGGTAYVNGV